MQFPSKKKRIASIINLVVSISLLLIITVLTRTEFILPPFIATAATKYPDPDWRRPRSFNVILSYLVCGAIGECLSLLGLYTLTFAVIAVFLAFAISVLIQIEHPPALLATFLGVIDKAGVIYLLHPILSGVVIIEGVNFLVTRYIEPSLR